MVACDAKNIYFYVHTNQPLTPFKDKNWMQLAIDADNNPKTGWNGYDFVVNRSVIDGKTTTVKRISDNKTWTAQYRASAGDLQIVVPRSILGLSNIDHTK